MDVEDAKVGLDRLEPLFKGSPEDQRLAANFLAVLPLEGNVVRVAELLMSINIPERETATIAKWNFLWDTPLDFESLHSILKDRELKEEMPAFYELLAGFTQGFMEKVFPKSMGGMKVVIQEKQP